MRAQSRRHGEARRSSYQTENIKNCQNGEKKTGAQTDTQLNQKVPKWADTLGCIMLSSYRLFSVVAREKTTTELYRNCRNIYGHIQMCNMANENEKR